MSAAKGEPDIRIVALGSGGIGKSAYVLQLICDRFFEDYGPSISDYFRREMTVDATSVDVEILDIAEYQNYTTEYDSFIKKCDGILMMYSVNNESTFECLTSYIIPVYIERLFGKGETPPMVLIGTQCDLEDKREVSTQQGQAFAQTLGCKFFETSAKTRTNVDESFSSLLRDVQPKYNDNLQSKLDEPKSSSCIIA